MTAFRQRIPSMNDRKRFGFWLLASARSQRFDSPQRIWSKCSSKPLRPSLLAEQRTNIPLPEIHALQSASGLRPVKRWHRRSHRRTRGRSARRCWPSLVAHPDRIEASISRQKLVALRMAERLRPQTMAGASPSRFPPSLTDMVATSSWSSAPNPGVNPKSIRS